MNCPDDRRVFLSVSQRDFKCIYSEEDYVVSKWLYNRNLSNLGTGPRDVPGILVIQYNQVVS